MERIKSFKITRIMLSNFRSYVNETVIETGDITSTKLQHSSNLVLITGDNGKVKSSIAHAVTYAFYGVSAFGVQDIDNIRNDENKPVSVTIDFINQNGEQHSFNRTRNGNITTLSMDSIKIQQKNVDAIFCDKDTFLSLFNPSYFIEGLNEKAKEFLSLRLPVVKKEDVFPKLTETERTLLNDEDLTVPDSLLQKLKTKNKQSKDNMLVVEGKLEQISEALKKAKTKKSECIAELESLEANINELTERKNIGVDVDELTIEKYFIQDKLNNSDPNSVENRRQNLLYQLSVLENKEFTSERQLLIVNKLERLNELSEQYFKVKERISTMQIGDCCPICQTLVTDENIEILRNSFNANLLKIKNTGSEEKKKYNDECTANAKEAELFEQNRQKEIDDIKAQLDILNADTGNRKLTDRLNEIDELMRIGNLTDTEYNDLICYEADKTTATSLLKVLDIEGKESEYKDLLNRKEKLITSIKHNTELITAVQEYIAKRSEIALSGLKMNTVTLKFYEIIRSTGELKSCFKFMYKNHEYNTLSLSEKLKAGIEVTSMLRNLMGFNYPMFIDNSESIGDFDSGLLPSQTFFMKFIKGSDLMIKKRDVLKERTPEQTAA